MTRALYFNRIKQKDLNAMSVLIFLEDGLAENTLIQRPFYLALVLLFPTLVARYTGASNFRLKFVLAHQSRISCSIYGNERSITISQCNGWNQAIFTCRWQKNLNFFCTVWEDTRSTIRMAESPKFTPRTKHISLQYLHYRHFVSNGTLKINHIDTLEQTADIFTKTLDQTKFEYLRKNLCGW